MRQAGPLSVLITGGTGYIGAHVAVELARHGHDVVLYDNLSNSNADAVDAIRRVGADSVVHHHADVLDGATLGRVMRMHRIDTVVHCAGLKSVNESVSHPALYYRQNVQGALTLVDAMKDADVQRIVFSSSATVYGLATSVPIAEDALLKPVNPYGRTKQIIEQILQDVCDAEPGWQAVALRYFNPAGAHPSGLLGEAPTGVPNNLFPVAGEVASGVRNSLSLFGNDYPTPDGSCVRDYVHIMDLARAHRLALESRSGAPGFMAVNLGTGVGYSVLEVIAAYRRASGARIPVEIAPRRPGDIATLFADPTRAERLWGWRARHGLDEMCQDAWRWIARDDAAGEHSHGS
ncbi:MAG: UDP-glucose 4-epimerase GalE [Proteobacteria bacterium]|nr:UDP-glucose 4-epimerase GalE [Burkholderiales bacterium]